MATTDTRMYSADDLLLSFPGSTPLTTDDYKQASQASYARTATPATPIITPVVKLSESQFSKVIICSARHYHMVDMKSFDESVKDDLFHWARAVAFCFWKAHTGDEVTIDKLAKQFDQEYGATEIGIKLAKLDPRDTRAARAQFQFMAPVWANKNL